MVYKDILTDVMTTFSKDPKVKFIGYNVRYGYRFDGTLKNCNQDSLWETPVAENLIMGLGMGMSLEGFFPIVCIERVNFLWVCMDALVNHLDKAEKLGWPPLKMIIRTSIRGTKPLNAGIQHTGDYSEIFKNLFSFPVITLKNKDEIATEYHKAFTRNGPTMLIEYHELYKS